jgi:DNA-binding transcriptional LysR family regulator
MVAVTIAETYLVTGRDRPRREERPMDLRLLEFFVSVAEEGSIHGGARRLLIAPPAVSKGLQRLEREVGTSLLLRSPQGVELSPAGVTLLAEARQILGRIEQAVALVRETGRQQRKITLGLVAGHVAAADLTTVIIQTFRRLRPDVTLVLRELLFAEHLEALARGDVDVALVRPPYIHDQVELTNLFDEPMLLCCRDDHALAEADALPVEQVLDEPMLDMGGSPRAWTSFWHLDEYRNGPARTGGDMAVNTLSEMRLAVECSGGPVVTPVAQSAWRLGMATAASPLRAIPLVGAPRSQVAAASRRGDTREDVAAFTLCARRICETLIDRIPDARVSATS